MGELIDLNPPKPIADEDLPPGVARDAETIAAINAHLAATDPHLQYATQAGADARYGLVRKIIFTGTTATTQGANSSITHGLVYSKILAFSGLVDHGNGVVTPGHILTPGYEFVLSGNSTGIFVGNVAGNSGNILSKPFRLVIDYSIN